MFLHSIPLAPGSTAMDPSPSYMPASERRDRPQPYPLPPSTHQEYLAQVCFMRQRQLLHARMLRQQQQQQQQSQYRRSYSGLRSNSYPPLRPYSRPRPYHDQSHHSRPLHQPTLQRLQDDLGRLQLAQNETVTTAATTMIATEHSVPWSPTFVGSEPEYQQRDPSLGKAHDHSVSMVDPRPPTSPLSSPKHTPNNELFSHALPSCSPYPNLYSKQTRSLSVVDSPRVVSYASSTLSAHMVGTDVSPPPSPGLGPCSDRHHRRNCTLLGPNSSPPPVFDVNYVLYNCSDHNPTLSKHLQTQAWVRTMSQATNLEDPQ